jgi:hypothetical protein
MLDVRPHQLKSQSQASLSQASVYSIDSDYRRHSKVFCGGPGL